MRSSVWPAGPSRAARTHSSLLLHCGANKTEMTDILVVVVVVVVVVFLVIVKGDEI